MSFKVFSKLLKVPLWLSDKGWTPHSDFILSPSTGTFTVEFRDVNDVTFAHNIFSFESEKLWNFINKVTEACSESFYLGLATESLQTQIPIVLLLALLVISGLTTHTVEAAGYRQDGFSCSIRLGRCSSSSKLMSGYFGLWLCFWWCSRGGNQSSSYL